MGNRLTAFGSANSMGKPTQRKGICLGTLPPTKRKTSGRTTSPPGRTAKWYGQAGSAWRQMANRARQPLTGLTKRGRITPRRPFTTKSRAEVRPLEIRGRQQQAVFTLMVELRTEDLVK